MIFIDFILFFLFIFYFCVLTQWKTNFVLQSINMACQAGVEPTTSRVLQTRIKTTYTTDTYLIIF